VQKQIELQYPLAAKVRQYADEIVSGIRASNKYVYLACKRHLNDLVKAKSKDYPYYWSPAHAEQVIRFVESMPHIKGAWTGKLIKLELWQCFHVGVPFGWLRKDNRKRRFRERYVEVPRKNGKTLIDAVLGLYMLTMDDEQGAEVYCGASKEKQAMLIFNAAKQMTRKNKQFQKYFGLSMFAKSITMLDTMSKFEPVIGEPEDGSSPHYGISDEGHQQKTSVFVDMIKTGMGAREQPMLSEITTAGTNISYPAYERSLYVKKVLDGVVEDDKLFGVIYTIDEAADWRDFDNWRIANPNLGVSVFEDYLRDRFNECLRVRAKQSINKCKHLNMWSGAGNGWLNIAKWLSNKTDKTLDDMQGKACYVAADFASKIDLCAVMFLFVDEAEVDRYYLFGRYYLPEETVEDSEIYQKFRDSGNLIVTDGAITDFRQIKEDIMELADRLRIKIMGFDPREASQIMSEIEDEGLFDCVEIPQSPKYFSEPMKNFEAAVEARQLITSKHDLLLDWTASNVIEKQNGRTKAYYPAKQANANKIDPIVAGIMTFKLLMDDDGWSPSAMVI
jgi:phage terminase large subunit-like protein